MMAEQPAGATDAALEALKAELDAAKAYYEELGTHDGIKAPYEFGHAEWEAFADGIDFAGEYIAALEAKLAQREQPY